MSTLIIQVKMRNHKGGRDREDEMCEMETACDVNTTQDREIVVGIDPGIRLFTRIIRLTHFSKV